MRLLVSKFDIVVPLCRFGSRSRALLLGRDEGLDLGKHGRLPFVKGNNLVEFITESIKNYHSLENNSRFCSLTLVMMA